MTTKATDNYTRANQSGWGTASDGVNVWGAPVNGNGTASIVSDRGVFGNVNNDTQMVCGSISLTDINMLVKVSTSDTGNLAGVLWRYSSASGGSGYRCGFYNGNEFIVDKYTSGARSNVVTASITAYTANTDQWIRLIHTSSGTLQIRWWPDGQSEPTNFNTPFVNQSETTYASGNFGVSVFILSGGTASYGSYTVTDNASSTSLVTQARATFKVRVPQQTRAISTFKTRASQITRALSHFLIPLQSLKVPLSIAFSVTSKLQAHFQTEQLLSVAFSGVSMAQPNTTISSIATLNDASNSPITNASSCQVTVTFPDDSQTVYTLTSGVTNLNNGSYSITYTTKTLGLIREEWKFVSSDTVTSVDALNWIPVSY